MSAVVKAGTGNAEVARPAEPVAGASWRGMGQILRAFALFRNQRHKIRFYTLPSGKRTWIRLPRKRWLF